MRGHIRQQGKGSWELKFDAGRDPITGHRRVRYVTFRGTKRKAEAELAKYVGAVSDGKYVDPSKLTVAEYLEQWLTDHAKHRVSAKTFERYAEIARKHLAPALGTHLLSKLAPVQIQAYYSNALSSARTRTKKGKTVEASPLSAQTIKHHHRVLSQALRQAVRLRLVERNPANDVDPPRPVGREMKILTPAEAAKLMKAAESTSIDLVVLLALTTGMRRGEVLGLQWKDVRQDARELSVTQTLEETKDGLKLKAPKTERSRRTIALPELAAEALMSARKKQSEALFAIGRTLKPSDDAAWRDRLVNCRLDGSPLRPREVTKAFGRLVKRLVEEEKIGTAVRFHDLRHTHISHLLAAGVHPKVASERAGHASVAITLDVYSHLVPGMQENAARLIDSALRTHLERS